MTYQYAFFKRIMDFFVALILIIILSPLILLSLLIQAIELRGNPIFVQERPGLNEQPFNIYKLKTMNNKTDDFGNLLPDHLRITRLGSFFRKASIDELPQLLNVLRGDMSFVGPRPLLMEYLPLYNEFEQKRHGVRPGITGMAQIKGRNAISWQEKFKLDVEYTENISLSTDLSILLKTVMKVLCRADIQSGENETMPKFKGSTFNDQEKSV